MSTSTRSPDRSHIPSPLLARMAELLRAQARVDAFDGRHASADRCRDRAAVYEAELAARAVLDPMIAASLSAPSVLLAGVAR